MVKEEAVEAPPGEGSQQLAATALALQLAIRLALRGRCPRELPVISHFCPTAQAAPDC